MKRAFEGENRILLYYFLMMIPLVMVTTPNASTNIIIRYGYFALLIFPLLKNPQFVPFVFLAFFGFSDNACYPFLLSSDIVRIALVIGLLLLHENRNSKLDTTHFTGYIVLYFYVLLVSLFYRDLDRPVIQNALLALLLAPFIQSGKDISRLALGFCLMSVALSLSYYINFKYYAASYGISEDFIVGSWQNSNTLAAAIGCGVPIIIAMSVDIIKIIKTKLIRILLIAGGVLAFMTVISLGSRGAFSAIALSSLLLLLFSSNLKRKQKIGLTLLIAVVALALYYWNVFDLLIYRFTNTDYSGTTESFGGRSSIWQMKLEAFERYGNLEHLLGIGINNTIKLGTFVSTHNDFLTALIGFGIIGFVLFIVFLFYPVLKGGTKRKKEVLFLLVFVIMESLVVEPLFRGHFHFWIFMVMLYKMSSFKSKGIVYE